MEFEIDGFFGIPEGLFSVCLYCYIFLPDYLSPTHIHNFPRFPIYNALVVYEFMSRSFLRLQPIPEKPFTSNKLPFLNIIVSTYNSYQSQFKHMKTQQIKNCFDRR